MDTKGIFVGGLEKRPANYQPLSPTIFLDWAATTYPNKNAIIHGTSTYSWSTFYKRCRLLASALEKRGLGVGDTVAILSPNTPAMLETHYGVPMSGAVLNTINFRLDPKTIAFILKHGQTKLLFVDREFSSIIKKALELCENPIAVIDIDDELCEFGEFIGEKNYEQFLDEGMADFEWQLPDDEWQAISLNYTSGTTGNPKGVVYHHRGAYLNGMGGALIFGLNSNSVYLWTLPMFHCNGWCYTWGVTSVGATHVCLRQTDPKSIFSMIKKFKVSHLCGAPVVLNMLVHAPENIKSKFDHQVDVATGGAAPPSTIISGMEKMGFKIHHLYGLTESYGPSTVCAWQNEWNTLSSEKKATAIARQGVRTQMLSGQQVANPKNMKIVPSDGKTVGELMLRGNTIMKGYLKNLQATNEAFAGGWFRTGDLAVVHPDNYVEIKDRSKDIIISGGENISSLEIEECLYKNEKIFEAAVVSMPHKKWGETPCAFIEVKPERQGTISEDEIISWCKNNMASFKAPTKVIFGPLPKTATGKIQKFVLRGWALNAGEKNGKNVR